MLWLLLIDSSLAVYIEEQQQPEHQLQWAHRLVDHQGDAEPVHRVVYVVYFVYFFELALIILRKKIKIVAYAGICIFCVFRSLMSRQLHQPVMHTGHQYFQGHCQHEILISLI